MNKRIKYFLVRVLQAIFFENYFFKQIFLKPLLKETHDIQTVLEIGAGINSYLRMINRNTHITAFEIDRNSIELAKKRGLYDNYIMGNATKLSDHFSNKSFDMVAAFDLIEHLPKKQGYQLIDQMLSIARKKIVILTPNGFLEQEPFDNNPYQKHLSGWNYTEMKKMGFTVYGVNGHRKLRGMYSRPVLRPVILGKFISNLSWLILKVFGWEDKSFSIMCFKQSEPSIK